MWQPLKRALTMILMVKWDGDCVIRDLLWNLGIVLVYLLLWSDKEIRVERRWFIICIVNLFGMIINSCSWVTSIIWNTNTLHKAVTLHVANNLTLIKLLGTFEERHAAPLNHLGCNGLVLPYNLKVSSVQPLSSGFIWWKLVEDCGAVWWAKLTWLKKVPHPSSQLHTHPSLFCFYLN